MSDEAKTPGKNGEWRMPEPVFRSSEGYTPKTASTAEDVPTHAPGKVDAGEAVQSVRTSEKFRVRHQKKKKRGCLKSLALTIAILVASAALIIATLIYFIFYSGPRGPF